jgi:hypothetical protein
MVSVVEESDGARKWSSPVSAVVEALTISRGTSAAGVPAASVIDWKIS